MLGPPTKYFRSNPRLIDTLFPLSALLQPPCPCEHTIHFKKSEFFATKVKTSATENPAWLRTAFMDSPPLLEVFLMLWLLSILQNSRKNHNGVEWQFRFALENFVVTNSVWNQLLDVVIYLLLSWLELPLSECNLN